MLKQKRHKIFIFLVWVSISSSAMAQDIGLRADNTAYIGLKLEQLGITNSYSGHITTYDAIRGFTHRRVEGRIEGGNLLSLKSKSTGTSALLDSKYVKEKIDGNTSWVLNDECKLRGRCFNVLSGTTLETDPKALDFLKYYSSNRENRGLEPKAFLSRLDSYQVLCKLGEKEFCLNVDQVGFVMGRTQVGVAQILASALGESTEVATFWRPSFDGALVASSPNVLRAVFRSTGGSLSDGVIDLNHWRVVFQPGQELSGINFLGLNIRDDEKFFRKISELPSAIDDINVQMREFFELLNDNGAPCGYTLSGPKPLFECYIHSTDLGLVQNAAWIKGIAIMRAYRVDSDSLRVDVHVFFKRKFGLKDDFRETGFTNIDYDNGDEARMAQLATQRIANSFQRYFQPSIEIWR